MGVEKELVCPRCGSSRIWRDGCEAIWENDDVVDKQRYRCCDCKKRFLNGLYLGAVRPERPERVEWFGVKIGSKKPKNITRESFSEPVYTVSYSQRKMITSMVKDGYVTIPNSIFLDETHYTDEYVRNHVEDCKRNYDLNMAYFNTLDKEEFLAYVEKFALRNRMKKTADIKELKEKPGVYMIVLGEYKQAYIGRSQDMKKRIMQHWSNIKEFDRRIFGTPENSILPIDAFGAFDTTGIYYKLTSCYDEIEEKLVSKFKKRYLLNRTAGGINAEQDDAYRKLAIAGSARRRNLKSGF